MVNRYRPGGRAVRETFTDVALDTLESAVRTEVDQRTHVIRGIRRAGLSRAGAHNIDFTGIGHGRRRDDGRLPKVRSSVYVHLVPLPSGFTAESVPLVDPITMYCPERLPEMRN